jgi:site-specific DNA-cytosine methylase
MKTLELFSGTQSFSKAAEGHDTTTVDILPLFNPDIVANILHWDYRVYPPGHFDVIWASPPCTEYSKAKTRGVRNLELADSLVRKTLEIIDYFQPRIWFIENVGTGMLVKRMDDIRPGLSKYFVDYCAYGKPYRKRTVIWSNIPLQMRLCGGSGICTQMIGNRRHKGSCGNGTAHYNSVGISSVWEKDSMPGELMEYILSETLKIMNNI